MSVVGVKMNGNDEHRWCHQDWHRCWDGGGKGEYDRYVRETIGPERNRQGSRASGVRTASSAQELQGATGGTAEAKRASGGDDEDSL